ncbi:type I-C CRISPR-associated protein Cas8c/Csd1 [Limisphaera sp. VF-2]|uniref:type I-C CRISPR-associated protein Cas8c/Csd1 n=1 Tax=Limisphaera sp. VF-2 TaxID=3400418 RepID=UPI003C22FF40
MLLKHLYDFAQSRKLLDDLAFALKPVRWLIHLDQNGNLLGQGPQETEGQRKNKGREYKVPKTSRATNSGTVADFLVDDIGAIFCLSTKPGEPPNERAAEKLKQKHQDFWRQIEEAKEATGDARFEALLRFKKSLAGGPPTFLRLNDEGTGWLVRTANGIEKPLGDDLFSFVVSGKGAEPLFEDETVRDHWRKVFAVEMQNAEQEAERGLCLVTGELDVPLARTHTPMVTGLPKPAKGTGAGIVGFESPSFRSYGFEKSYNAPTSIAASKGYLLALQFLSKHQDHWLSLGPAWLCFWAVESEQASSLFARLLRRPDPLTVRTFMSSPWSGLEKPPPATDKFIAITLTAAGPRIVIKDWLQMPLVDAAENFRRWFQDLTIGDDADTPRTPVADEEQPAPLAVRRLAGCVAPLTLKDGRLVPDYEVLQPDIAAQLYRAALEGTAPSISLIKPILDQLHSKLVGDKNYQLVYDQSRFALLKLILNRNRKANTMTIEPKLIHDTDDPAYNCGRLLAILAAAQDKAHEYKLEGPGVAERYFGTASVSPASVFPLLLRLNRHHLNKIAKSERFAGHERFISEQIQQVLTLFKPEKPGQPPAFPRTLDLQAQGRFALGFYQQQAADVAARQAAQAQKNNSSTSNAETT